MKKLLRAGLLAALALSLVAVGCGDDDETPTGGTTKIAGDLTDPEFLATQDAMDNVYEFTDMMLGAVFAAMDTVLAEADAGSPGRHYADLQNTGIEADSIYEVLVYHPTTFYWYHHRYARLEFPSDTLFSVITDSIQFLHPAGPVQWPDTAVLTGVNHGIRFELSNSDDEHVVATQQFGLVGDLVHEGDITINGSQSFDVLLSPDSDSCSIDLDMNATATNIEMNIAHTDAGGCPSSGVMRHTGTIAIECTGTPALLYNDSWTVTETFTGDDTYSLVVENSTTRWTHSGSCLD